MSSNVYVASNNANSTLAGNLTMSFSVYTGQGSRFPVINDAGSDNNEYTKITLHKTDGTKEIVCVVRHDTGTDDFTIGVPGTVVGSTSGRGQEGTSATSWSIGDVVACRPTAAMMEEAVNLGDKISSCDAKTTPVDADAFGISDSAASGAGKKFTWANLRTAIFAYMPTAIAAAASKAAPDDADMLPLYDSAATTTQTKLSWANIKAALVATINTWTAKQIFTGTMKVQQSLEKVTVTAGSPAATANFDWLTQAIQYYTSAGTNNWTLNVRGDGSTSLDSLMATGESITISLWATMTGTPYYSNAMTIDGSSVTPKWLGGVAPSAGDENCINVYAYTITKTGAATFTVIASKTKTT